MKQIVVLLIVTAAISGILVPFVSAQGNGSTDLAAAAYREMIEDIEVMRRILHKSLIQHLARKKDVAADTAKIKDGETVAYTYDEKSDKNIPLVSHLFLEKAMYNSYKQGNLDLRGYYIPGSGVVYSLQVGVPAREEPAAEGKENPGDLWETTESEIRRGEASHSRKTKKTKTFVIDEKAVDAVIDHLITTVAKHASNMEHLHSSDQITLLIDFKGRTSLNQVARITGETALQLYSEWAADSSPGINQDVILQMQVSFLPSYKSTGDIEVVKRAMRISRYPGVKKSYSSSGNFLFGSF